jgi:hypothetical protein
MIDLTKFTTRRFRLKKLHDWAEWMSKKRQHPQTDFRVAKVLDEQGFTWEETPRSLYDPEKLYEALKKFEPGRISDPSVTGELKHGINLAYACFACPKKHRGLFPLPLTLDTVKDLTTNPQASAGFTDPHYTKEECMEKALNRAIETVNGVKAPEPCMAFARTHWEGKVRLIWGYPYSMTILEGLLARPLINWFKRANSPLAFGKTTLHLGTDLRVSSYHNNWAYSLDMSSFDASVAKSLIHIGFNILKTWFNLEEVEPVTGRSYREIFKIVETYFIHTPIIMPNMHMYKGKRHGVPSGSYFTQLIDSIVNVIILGTVSSRFNLQVDKEDIYVLGDDLLFWCDRDISIEALAGYASKAFGVEFHPSKCGKYKYNEAIKYLGRVWEQGSPTLDLDEVIKRMVNPERRRKYSKDPRLARIEVNQLIYSYAKQYASAYPMIMEIYGSDISSRRGTLIIEMAVEAALPNGWKINPDNLSGLQRYKFLHSSEEEDCAGSKQLVPQYWL